MRDRNQLQIRKVAEYILKNREITEIKTIEMLFKKKSKNNIKMSKIDLKKDKIKISKMIMTGKMKKEMVVEMAEETKIAYSQKHNLKEALPKNFLEMMLMIKIDFIENTAQYLKKDILNKNLSQDRDKEEVIKNLNQEICKGEVIKNKAQDMH